MPARIYSHCTLEDCDRPHKALGLCNFHYLRQHRHGTTDHPRPRGVCTVEECGRPSQARGLCKAHYFRWFSGSGKTGPIGTTPAQGPIRSLPPTLSRDQWLVYTAGFLDGEGSICIRRRCLSGRLTRGFVLNISAQQVDPAPLWILQSVFGGHVCDPKHKGSRPIYAWKVTAIRAVQALKELLPYLIVKRSQAECALELAETIQGPRPISDEVLERREDICRRLAALKRQAFPL